MQIFLSILLIIYVLGLVLWPILLWKAFNSEEFKKESDLSTSMMSAKSVKIAIAAFTILWPIMLIVKPFMAKKEPYKIKVIEDEEPWYDKVNRENEKNEVFGGIFDIDEMHQISDEDAEMLKDSRRKRYISFNEKEDE